MTQQSESPGVREAASGEADPARLTDEEFKSELIAVAPHLRAFARSLTLGPDSDDLAQEAMLKAWNSRNSFRPGTNLKAWTFMILRNVFLSGKRRSWRQSSLDPETAENTLVANDDPYASEELLDVRNAMQHLPVDQREALVLIAAAGLSYEQTAEICGCAVGTIKSRVNRARAGLAALMEQRTAGHRETSEVSSSDVFDDIMMAASSIRRRLEAEGSAA